jgi:hypothetical protein
MADLTTQYVAYIVTLKTAAPTAKDVTTLLAKDLPTARAGAAAENRDDYNTMIQDYLTP